MIDKYILTLQDINGLIVKYKNEYYQLMITEDYDVSFQLFFGEGNTDAETAAEILDYIYSEKMGIDTRNTVSYDYEKVLTFLDHVRESVKDIQKSCNFTTEPCASGEGEVVVSSDCNYEICEEIINDINFFEEEF